MNTEVIHKRQGHLTANEKAWSIVKVGISLVKSESIIVREYSFKDRTIKSFAKFEGESWTTQSQVSCFTGCNYNHNTGHILLTYTTLFAFLS